MCDSNWLELSSQGDFDRLADITKGFHDGIIKELFVISPDYVRTDLKLVLRGFPALLVLIQMQNQRTPAVALLFSAIQTFSIDQGMERSASFELEPEGVEFGFLSCSISAKACHYLALGEEFLGSGPFSISRDTITKLPLSLFEAGTFCES